MAYLASEPAVVAQIMDTNLARRIRKWVTKYREEAHLAAGTMTGVAPVDLGPGLVLHMHEFVYSGILHVALLKKQP
jgi:hypothetical protein